MVIIWSFLIKIVLFEVKTIPFKVKTIVLISNEWC